MSHVVAIELVVKDLDARAVAAHQLGAELKRGQKTYKWFGRWMQDYNGKDAAYRKVDPKDYGKCEHAISHPDCGYEIGLVKQPDGFLIVADEWHTGGLTNAFGPGMAKLKQRYGAVVAAKTMRRQGWMVKEKLDAETGDLRLVCTR